MEKGYGKGWENGGRVGYVGAFRAAQECVESFASLRRAMKGGENILLGHQA